MKINFLHKILFFWALFWGICGLGLYFLGLLGLFYRPIVISYGALSFLAALLIFKKKKIKFETGRFFSNFFKILKKDRIVTLALTGFLAFAILNFLISLAPEVGFDALWYHLTLPKIYLTAHKVFYISGGLLYYSVMPRLAEMIYGFGLALNPSGFLPKIIHYLFGLFWFGGTYLVSRHFLSRRGALLSALACYGTYLVTWLSQTAYIDLIVAFYGALALFGFFKFLDLKKPNYLYFSAVAMGLVLSSKLYGLFLFVVLFIVLLFTRFRMAIRFALISLLIVLPFYLQAYFSTGNPFYPLFSVQDSALEMYTDGYGNLKDWYLNLWWRNLPGLFWQMAVYRLAPVFALIFLFFLSKDWRKIILPILIYIGFFFLWSLNPVQEARYFIIIVPILAAVSFYVLENTKGKIFKGLAIALFIIGLIYNFSFSLDKFKESIEVVFKSNLRGNYLRARLVPPRNFYDFSGNFKKGINDKKVLTVNVHNLFYVDFDFWDLSFIENKFNPRDGAQNLAQNLKKEGFDYVLIGHFNAAEWWGFSKEETDLYFKEILKENDFTLYKVLGN